MVVKEEESSFRDPSGQVIIENGKVLRFINATYFGEYHKLMSSGLYDKLVVEGLIVSHKEIGGNSDRKLIEPEQISFISYPYEWPFSLLKQAALTTLKINRVALDYGMMLKDASAFNIQWQNGKMVLIDTLSFIEYQDGQPWMAYKQFMQHFMSPLLLMAYGKPHLSKLSEFYIDGIPVNIASKLLPLKAKLNLSVLLNYLPLSFTGKIMEKQVRIPKRNLLALLDNLERMVKSLNYKVKSAWSNYADAGSYSETAKKSKDEIVKSYLDMIPKGTLWDCGANIGRFSQMASASGHKVVATDIDFDCVESIPIKENILPLVIDVCNPTPAIGWQNKERKPFLDRANFDTVMALALLHHLCIGNNIPLSKVAQMFSEHCKYLIVEFVPPDDPKVQILAGGRIFPEYNRGISLDKFSEYYSLLGMQEVEDSCRSIYLLKRGDS